MKAMTRHRSHSIEFKRQVAQEYIAGETLHALAKRHDVSRNLIRIWICKYEAGAFDDDFHAADLLQEHEAKIAALERMVELLHGLRPTLEDENGKSLADLSLLAEPTRLAVVPWLLVFFIRGATSSRLSA